MNSSTKVVIAGFLVGIVLPIGIADKVMHTDVVIQTSTVSLDTQSPVAYEVQRGETLRHVADATRSPGESVDHQLADIRRLNPSLRSTNTIHQFQLLKVR